MIVRVENDEIVAAITVLIGEQIPNASVEAVVFTRRKGGGVYADVVVKAGKPK